MWLRWYWFFSASGSLPCLLRRPDWMKENDEYLNRIGCGKSRLINELCLLRRRGCRLHFSYSSTCLPAYVRYSRNLIVLPPSKLPSVSKLWAGVGSSLAHSLITTKKHTLAIGLQLEWEDRTYPHISAVWGQNCQQAYASSCILRKTKKQSQMVKSCDCLWRNLCVGGKKIFGRRQMAQRPRQVWTCAKCQKKETDKHQCNSTLHWKFKPKICLGSIPRRNYVLDI